MFPPPLRSDGRAPYYSEPCAAVMAVTYSSGVGPSIVSAASILGSFASCSLFFSSPPPPPLPSRRLTGTVGAQTATAAPVPLRPMPRACLPWLWRLQRTKYDFIGRIHRFFLTSHVLSLPPPRAEIKASWRDVQHIIARSCQKNDPSDGDWSTNKAGLHINHKWVEDETNCR